MNPSITKTAAALAERGFEVHTAESGADARALVLSMIGKDESITFGGSATSGSGVTN